MDLYYLSDEIFLIQKKGEDQFVAALCSINFLESHGVKITAKVGEANENPEKQKGKEKQFR